MTSLPLLLCACLLAACATMRGTAGRAQALTSPGAETVAKPKAQTVTKPKAETVAKPKAVPVPMAEAEDSRDDSSADALRVPGPDGKARVVVTAEAVCLQRQKDGPLEELERPWDFEERDLAKKRKALAKSVRWSPRGTHVCFQRDYKRGSAVAVFALAEQPAAEVELTVWREAMIKRYGSKYRHGRFYYDVFSRWIDEDHLELDIAGNLDLKDDEAAESKFYHGIVRVELGPKSATVQGEPKLGPLTDDWDKTFKKAQGTDAR